MDSSALESLSDPRRLAIVELLAGGERCLCDISGALGISDALASHHLKNLREAGVVIAERRGVWLHCRIDPDTLERTGSALAALASQARDSAAVPTACCPPADDGGAL
ncbi:MAG: metalloregulator ArsR/SmtB family transcription factor [Coriobacteriia bacterium]|nr:metalloregulator ArsR/SmtB family transcription factor [Coriobacteriia bacterium]